MGGMISAMLCLGCYSVQLPSGSLIPGTEDVRPRGEANFLLSPDSRRLLFRSNRDTPFQPIYVLVDLETLDRREILLGPEATQLVGEGRGPVQSSWRWSRDSVEVLLHNETHFFIADVSVPAPIWSVSRTYERQRLAQESQRPIAIIRQQHENEALLLSADDPSRVLARYTRMVDTRVKIVHLTQAPDGSAVSYVVESFVVGFPAPSTGYVLFRHGAQWSDPVKLAAPVFGPVRWSSDSSTFYACARADRSQLGIHRWASDELRPALGY